MTKFQWEQQLSKYLSELPKEERGKVLEYYDELFCDKYESGESEDRIIVSFGEPSRIALEILRSYDSGMLFADNNQKAMSSKKTFMPPPIPSQDFLPKMPKTDIFRKSPENNYPPYHNQSNQDTANTYEAFNQRGDQFHQSHQQREYRPNYQADYKGGFQRGYGNTAESNSRCSKKKNPLFIILCIFLFITIGLPLLVGLFGIIVGVLATVFGFAICSVVGLIYAVATLFMNLSLAQTLAQLGISLFVSGVGFICIPIGAKILKGLARLFTRIKSWLSGKSKVERINKQY